MNDSPAVQNQFQIFPCGPHEWCCLRADRMVCGYFVNCESALRFARREGGAEITFAGPQVEGGTVFPRAA